MLALEINDVGLILARDGSVIAEEPGCAMLDGAEPQTGAEALRRVRSMPLHAEFRHWQDLGSEPLPRRTAAAANAAAIAHAQLAAIARGLPAGGRAVLIATPAWYTREQLALLLGIAGAAGFEVAGLVDAGLAAVSLEAVPESMLQLELTLHRTVLTVLDHAGELRRTRYELLPQHGWLALQQAWLETIAATFVRRTRYDPLHEAAAEQRLWDGLPQWLETLRSETAVRIEMEAPGRTVAVEIERAELESAAQGIYESVIHAAQRMRPGRGRLHLAVSHRWAVLPGFVERLATLRDSDVRVLPRGAAAFGALAWAEHVRRPSRAITLVQRLPVARAAEDSPAPQSTSAVPERDRPTHVVLDGRAWTLGPEALVLGSAVPGGRRAITVPPGPGISRTHCSLVRDAAGAWLEDHSTYGTLLNGERVTGRVPLRAGDRLRVGSPGVECALVRVVDGDGAA
jgi:hypothetical protein